MENNFESVLVAIQGDVGSYHDKAARHYFGARYTPQCFDTFEDVFESVATGRVEYGLSAVENSLVGSIVPVYDLLRATNDVSIVGEIFLAIHHSLIGFPEATLARIRDVYSHPVALDQCREFLKRELPHAAIHPTSDTAGSVTYIKERGDISAAAIASADNAKRLGLRLFGERIEDNPENYTRFLILGRSEGSSFEHKKADKTSLLIERLTDKADDAASGTLYNALGCFASNDVSLTKVESRPIQGRPWRYMFYLDCAAGAEEPRMEAALQALSSLGATWRLLGTYRAGETIQ